MALKQVTTFGVAVAAFAAMVTARPAFAQGKDGCHVAQGKAVFTVIPPSVAPASDPLGRVVGPATGDLKAAVTAYLTDLSFAADGVHSSSVETWVLGPQDLIRLTGVELFRPIPGTPNVEDTNTLTVLDGTGKYAGATGTIQLTGIGYNLLASPTPEPGKVYFDLRYRGTICTQ